MQPYQIVIQHLGEEIAKLFEELRAQAAQKADSIVLLQGDRFDRVNTAASLYRKGFAPFVVISGNNELTGPDKRPEENDTTLHELFSRLTESGIPEKAIILENKSFQTRDQARNTVKLAIQKGWEQMLVVTSGYHVLRAYRDFSQEAEIQHWKGCVFMQAAVSPWDLVPGGRQRTALEMLEIEMKKIKEYAEEWRLRKVEKNDCVAIYEIKNDPCARANSLRTEPIIWEEHQQWFERYCMAGDTNFWIVLEHFKEIVGYCRVDKKNEGWFEVSIALRSAFQGKGLGHFLLHNALKEFFDRFPDGMEVRARVRKENEVSLRLFQRHNFHLIHEDEIIYTLSVQSHENHC